MKSPSWKALLIGLAAIWIPLGILLRWLGLQSKIPLALLIVEPAATANLPWFTGIVSTWGCFLWCGAGAIALFSGSLCGGRRRWCLVMLGTISLWLACDDAFMLHEVGLPNMLLGSMIDESYSFQRAIYTVYGAVVFAWLVIFRRLIQGREALLLLLALIWLAASMGLDTVSEAGFLPRYSRLVRDRAYYNLVEDGCKLMGIATWTFYIWLFSHRLLQPESGPTETAS